MRSAAVPRVVDRITAPARHAEDRARQLAAGASAMTGIAAPALSAHSGITARIAAVRNRLQKRDG